MTDNDIKKALECCEVGKDKCRKCPFHCTVPACSRYLAQSALDLINRQQAEIEKLTKIEHFATKTIEKQSAEIEKKTTQCERLEIYMDELVKQKLNQTKSEALKEFWKRFDKVLCENIGPSKRVYWKISSDGNNLVKEMTE